jgi:hypothetical protein
MFNDIVKVNLIYFIFGILFIIKFSTRTAMYRIAFGFILIATMGCGPAKITISGKVSYDGMEVNEGAISFESPDGKSPSVGGMIQKGFYKIENVDVSSGGKKIVRINAVTKTGRKIPAGPPFPPGDMVDEIIKMPARFNEKSNLSAEISSSKPNVFDFNLSKGLVKP